MLWRDRVTHRTKVADTTLREIQAVFTCSHCSAVMIGRLWNSKGWGTSALNGEGLWAEENDQIAWQPQLPAGKDFPDVPAPIASAADEAHRCRSIGALRASILLARGVLEATAKDNEITKGRLAEKIDELESKGLVRPFTRDAAHELRYLGNDMAHGDFVDTIVESDCIAVLDIVDEVLNEVYQGPARVVRMKEKRTGLTSADGESAEPGDPSGPSTMPI